MKKLITLLFLSLAIFTAQSATPFAIDQNRADKAAERLRFAKGTSDSIKILYDVYDLSDQDKKREVGYKILDMAQRTNDRETTIDILNALALKVEDTDALSRFLEMSINLPQDSASRGTTLLLQMEKAKAEAKALSPDDRDKLLLEYAKVGLDDHEDIYSEILDLYKAMVFLGMSSQGSLYLEYITRLQDLMKQLPESDFAIKNLVYSTAAIYYTRKQDYPAAIEACRTLLKQIEDLRSRYQPGERRYQTFDYFRYVVYRRMLENFKGLTPSEIQDLYNKCVELAETNQEVAAVFDQGALTNSYYNMAIGNYKDAVPYLKKALSNDSLSLFRQQELLGHLVEATEAIGDKAAHYEAMKAYIDVIQEAMKVHSNDAKTELKLRTDVNRMAYEERQEAEMHKMENRRMRKISITLVYLLGIAIILMCGNYFRMRSKVKRLSRQVRGLHHNLQDMFDDGTPLGTHDARIQRGKLKG